MRSGKNLVMRAADFGECGVQMLAILFVAMALSCMPVTVQAQWSGSYQQFGTMEPVGTKMKVNRGTYVPPARGGAGTIPSVGSVAGQQLTRGNDIPPISPAASRLISVPGGAVQASVQSDYVPKLVSPPVTQVKVSPVSADSKKRIGVPSGAVNVSGARSQIPPKPSRQAAF